MPRTRQRPDNATMYTFTLLSIIKKKGPLSANDILDELEIKFNNPKPNLSSWLHRMKKSQHISMEIKKVPGIIIPNRMYPLAHYSITPKGS